MSNRKRKNRKNKKSPGISRSVHYHIEPLRERKKRKAAPLSSPLFFSLNNPFLSPPYNPPVKEKKEREAPVYDPDTTRIRPVYDPDTAWIQSGYRTAALYDIA